MADPTQAARDKVGGFLKNLLPANSPLGQSVEAGNPSVLTEEAQKKRAEADALDAEALKQAPVETGPSPAQEISFVPPKLEATAVQNQPSNPNLMGMYDRAAGQEVATQSKLGADEAKVYNDQAKIVQDQAAQEQVLADKRDADLASLASERDAAQKDLDSFKVEPSNFFSNKSTWQKIVGGIGLFLGSITPEGARNVASIVDKEIERDVDRQKQDYTLKKGKVDAASNRYKLYMDKYKDDQLARMAMQKEKLVAGEFYLRGLQSSAKGDMARSKTEMGRVEIASKIADLEQKQFERMQKLNAPNKTQAKGLSDMEASADTIKASLGDLSKIVKGTGEAIPFTEKNDRAKQLVNDIQLQLKEIKKLGVLSGSDDKRLDNYLGDPSFFKSDARMQGQIDGVMDLVNKALNAQRKAIGAKDPNAVAGFKPKNKI